jgi:hypothetical protein
MLNEEVMIHFLENLITQLDFPTTLIFYNSSYFSSLKLNEFPLDKGIILQYAANYYPKGIALAQSTNKNPIHILKRTIIDH